MDEHPRAISVVMALRMLFSLMISRAVMPCSSMFMIAMPACLASMVLPLEIAGMLPLPGRAIPIASQRQFIELAVYIPEHEPHPGQTFCSYSRRPSSSMMPAL